MAGDRLCYMTGGPEIGVWANGRLGQELGREMEREHRWLRLGPCSGMTDSGVSDDKNWVGEEKSASRFVRRPQRRAALLS